MADKICKCGCGQPIIVNRWHRWKGIPEYKLGHNARVSHPMLGKKASEETIKKLRDSHKGQTSWMKGKTHSPETRKRLRETHLGKKQTPELIAKRVAARDGYRHSEETLKKIGLGNKGKIQTAETREKCSIANKGKRYSPNTEFTSSLLKKRYQDPEYVQKMAKAWNIKPNKPETFILGLLNDLYPNQWKYTGDFSFTINGKCPDFVNCNGQKKIIELFGDYWHRGQNPQERINLFKDFGYDTLVIWEHELKSLETLTLRIQQFEEVSNG